jgi:hypothetical protein
VTGCSSCKLEVTANEIFQLQSRIYYGTVQEELQEEGKQYNGMGTWARFAINSVNIRSRHRRIIAMWQSFRLIIAKIPILLCGNWKKKVQINFIFYMIRG